MPIKDVHQLFEHHWRTVAEANDEIRYSLGKDFQTLLLTVLLYFLLVGSAPREKKQEPCMGGLKKVLVIS
jgi:hypothetical protein